MHRGKGLTLTRTNGTQDVHTPYRANSLRADFRLLRSSSCFAARGSPAAAVSSALAIRNEHTSSHTSSASYTKNVETLMMREPRMAEGNMDSEACTLPFFSLFSLASMDESSSGAHGEGEGEETHAAIGCN